MRKYVLALGLMTLNFMIAAANPPEEKITTASVLKSVTVYRSGAEMLHTAAASLKAGSNELSIEGLSSYIDINSIRVNCPAAVTILGLEFSNNFMGEEHISPTVKKLKDSAENVSNDIARVDVLIKTSDELLEVLRNNKEVKGSNAGLSVAELTKLMNYYEAKSIEVQNKLLQFNERKNRLQLLLLKINNQVNEEQKKNTRSGGRLVLQVSAAFAGNYDFTLTYITQNAFWTAYYDIKADNIKSPLTFIYKAKIIQTTGIDWKKVKLSLSTATPSQYGNAPVLKTWFLGYIDPVNSMNLRLRGSNSIEYDLQGKLAGAQLQEVVVTAYGTRQDDEVKEYRDPLYVVNGVIMSKSEYAKINKQVIKSKEILKDAAAAALYGSQAANGAVIVTLKDGLEDYITVSESQLDVTYDIDIPYDVPTNGKPQIATLQETTVPASYKYYAVPKLSKDAFLLAEVANWQKLNLLPGDANIIFEGTYIGKSFIDPASTSDTLNLTLGTDKRVVIKKEKLTDFSSIKFLGSNKLQTLSYDITVKNNKKEPISILLKEQYPISTNKEIEVELLESSGGSIDEEIGVISWKLDIEPGQHKKIRFSYSAKYPKGKKINLN